MFLKRPPVLRVVVLTLITAGLYPGFWYLWQRKGLNALDSSSTLSVAEPVILVALCAIFLSAPSYSNVASITRLAVGVSNVLMAFKVRWMLAKHLARQLATAVPESASMLAQYEPSSLPTFFLNISYLQYKINELIQVSSVLTGQDSAGRATDYVRKKTNQIAST